MINTILRYIFQYEQNLKNELDQKNSLINNLVSKLNKKLQIQDI